MLTGWLAANEPGAGHRFDDEKILFDPYAGALFRHRHFSREAARIPGSNAGRAPLGVIVTDHGFDWTGDRRPTHTSDTVIYEMHVRGFTMRANSGVPAEQRGTYAGLITEDPVPEGARNYGGRVAPGVPAGFPGRQLLGIYAAEFLLSPSRICDCPILGRGGQ